MGQKIGIKNISTIDNYACMDTKIKSLPNIQMSNTINDCPSIINEEFQIYNQEMVDHKVFPCTTDIQFYNAIYYSQIIYQPIYYSEIIYN